MPDVWHTVESVLWSPVLFTVPSASLSVLCLPFPEVLCSGSFPDPGYVPHPLALTRASLTTRMDPQQISVTVSQHGHALSVMALALTWGEFRLLASLAHSLLLG